jgi:phage FluMu protein Com
MRCLKCGKGLLGRAKRQGWLERQVLWRLGYYPWQCGICKDRNLMRVREEVKDKPSEIWTG